MSKDYYNILGISQNANQDEIKRAYRKLAHQHHPDKSGGNEEKFKEINEAYHVLSDEKKRQQYDQFGSVFESAGGQGPGGFNWQGAGDPFQGFRTNINFEDLGDIFGDMFGFRGASHKRSDASRRGRDLEYEIAIDLADVVKGITKNISLKKPSTCKHCYGKGNESPSSLKKCDQCQGKGIIEHIQKTIFGSFASQTSCPNCGGEGSIIDKPCKKCNGEGRIIETQELAVEIPAGVDNGTTLRMQGKGEAGIRGSSSGDLYVTVRVKPNAKFKREGDDIHSNLNVNVTQAALGSSIKTEVIDSKVEINIPSGTQPNDIIRLKGKGIPRLRGSGRGDHFLHINIEIPTRLNRKQKKLFEDLAKEIKV